MMQSLVDLQRWLYGSAIEALNSLSGANLSTVATLVASAFFFGMLHALLPGHGKAVLTARYAGNGRYGGAVGSSVVVILTHVGSAIILVLTGFAILQRTIGGAGRAPMLEQASQITIVVIGIWLLWRAVRPHRHDPDRPGPALAVAAGLAPCPLTAFIMTYAVAHGIVMSGLMLSGAFALGMVATVAAFPLAAVMLRQRFVDWIARATPFARRIGPLLEVFAAVAIVMLGLYPLLSR